MLTALVNHLWQSTLFGVLAAALALLLRNESAAVRYWIWWAASAKFLVPFAALVAVGSLLAPTMRAAVVLPEWSASLERLAEPVGTELWAPALAALTAVWLAGVLATASVFVVQWLRVRRMVRAATPWRAPSPTAPAVMRSSAQIEPAIVGIVRPVLIVPDKMIERLTPAQLDAVIEHELCHWRRRDNLTAAVHMIAAALFWFHPLVWWIGRQLLQERERACDEGVIAAGHDRVVYAEAILDVCELCVASPSECAAGVGGAHLKRRLTQIVTSAAVTARSSVVAKAVLAVAGLAALAGPLAVGALGGRLAYAQAGGDVDRGRIAAPEDHRALMPLVRIAPSYPADALALRLEGSVTVRFTILPDGTTADVVAVDSTSSVFEEPAVSAVLKWRYPAQAQELRGVLTVIRFQLEPDTARANPRDTSELMAAYRGGGQELVNVQLGAFTPQEQPLPASFNGNARNGAVAQN